MSAAVGIGIATIIAQYLTEQQRQAAEARANAEGRELSQEEIDELARQFDITTEEGWRQFNETMGETQRQFNLERGDAARGSETELTQAAGAIRTGDIRERSRRKREAEINLAEQGRFGAYKTDVLSKIDPYSQAGTQALEQQRALLGLSGAAAQQAEYNKLAESPGQRFLRERQERAILRNSAALGGTGGGNVMTALQENAFGRAQTDIDKQVDRLGGLTQQGMTAAQLRASLGYGPAYIQTGEDVGLLGSYNPDTGEYEYSDEAQGVFSDYNKMIEGYRDIYGKESSTEGGPPRYVGGPVTLGGSGYPYSRYPGHSSGGGGNGYTGSPVRLSGGNERSSGEGYSGYDPYASEDETYNTSPYTDPNAQGYRYGGSSSWEDDGWGDDISEWEDSDYGDY